MTERRSFLRIATVAGATLGLPAWARALIATPAMTEGPFYPRELPLDQDNDLTRVEGAAGVASGVLLDLSGRVIGLNGAPAANARVEIWQCNAFGRYHHPADTSKAPLDPNFQGFGKTITDQDGRYRFRTIKPAPYPGRTPHIHFRVVQPAFGSLTTQMFVAGEPQNERDFLFRSLRDDRLRALMAAPLQPAPAGSDVALTGQFDIVIGASLPG